MRSWRTAWGQGDFPFVIIQIPGWKNHYPELREAQLLATQKEPNAALVVITDCDDTLDVHPGNKEPVGIRASLPALALAYGKKKMEYAGPQYQSMQVKGSEARIRFAHAGKGLVAKGGTLQDFEIAGADGKFVPAKAVINGKDEVVVSAAGVPIPVAVRMGWRLSPQVNLYNSEGLCAAAFRTNVD
jgi:sialate O-acetylesterase